MAAIGHKNSEWLSHYAEKPMLAVEGAAVTLEAATKPFG
jgi:hypothetical protein